MYNFYTASVHNVTICAILYLCFLPTGPKLYKEPSAKSNKHIIQNALAHCCLAGKVNEGQKNKILDVCNHVSVSFYIKEHSTIIQ